MHEEHDLYASCMSIWLLSGGIDLHLGHHKSRVLFIVNAHLCQSNTPKVSTDD
jgi:hypothetical protein